LPRFIYSLGIRFVGEETAFALAGYFGSVDKIGKAAKDELEKVPDVGGRVAESIFGWFRKPENLKLLEKMEKAGIKVKGVKISQKLRGKVFVLTGSLEVLTRDEAKKKIRMAGGDVSGSVSRETDYVVVGAEPGSKYKKAKELGIKILSEKEFLRMVE